MPRGKRGSPSRTASPSKTGKEKPHAAKVGGKGKPRRRHLSLKQKPHTTHKGIRAKPHRSYKTYIYKAFNRQLETHEDAGGSHEKYRASTRAMAVLHATICQLICRLADKAEKLRKAAKQQTLTFRDIKGAVELIVPFEDAKMITEKAENTMREIKDWRPEA